MLKKHSYSNVSIVTKKWIDILVRFL
jgi:hypothetical protein